MTDLPEQNSGKKINRRDFIKKSGKVVAGAFLATSLAGTGLGNAAETRSLTLLTTTDEHQYILPYNYMDDAEDQSIGLSKTLTLVEEERKSLENTLLLSNGDTIQGSIIGDYEYRVNPLERGETQTIVEILNDFGYEAASVGNHELQDYGMDFFEKALKGADYPYISANIRIAGTDEYYVKPYTVVEKELDGEIVKIGIVGFTPPQTIEWGRGHLEGNLEMDPIDEAAERVMPAVRAEADIVIALAHTGMAEGRGSNYSIKLAQVEGFDALIFGHDHNYFPGDYDELEMVDNDLGLINGLPAVMAGSWGSAVGAIDLELMKENGQWRLAEAGVRLNEITEDTPSHSRAEELAEDIHKEAVEYVRTPVAEADSPFTSFFARAKDAAITQIINEAQLEYGYDFRANNPEYSDHGVLAAAAPFRFGREGPRDFTRVSDEIRISDINDIYMFPNEIRIVELNGQQVIDWLEVAAENFNQVDPNSSEPQEILNPEFMGYNWDVIDGIEYEIDITQPTGERIVDPNYQGEPLTSDQNFLVVTNNHRASGGGSFPHLDGSTIVYSTPTTHQEILIEFLDVNEPVEANNNWRIKPFDHEGDLIVRSHPEGDEYIASRNLDFIEYLETDEDGWGIYRFFVN